MAPMAAGESGRVQKLGTMAIPVSACCEASLPHVFSKTQSVRLYSDAFVLIENEIWVVFLRLC
jgi:hypothetical protein